MKKTKVCNTCGKRKPLDQFSVNNSTPDGKRHYCKPCATIKIRNYRATGKTTEGALDGKSMRVLDISLKELDASYKKYGFKLSKVRL